MKKMFYAVMLLLGLSILLTACNNSGTSKNASVEKERTNDSRSNASIQKEWTKEMEANGHMFFKTGYVYSRDHPIHMLMMPYVFSKDGTRGVIYAVYAHNYGEWLGMSWYAQYEVNGEHLLLTDVVDIRIGEHPEHLELCPQVMKIEHNNGIFVLKGRFPSKGNQNPIGTFYQESDPSGSEYYICLVENGRWCMHK